MATSSLDCTSVEFAEVSSGFLRAGISLRFTARGASMFPLVRNGDILLVKPIKPEEIHLGDVVLFLNRPNQVLVHRVLLIKRKGLDSYFKIQGDQVTKADGWFTKDQIIGKLFEIERSGEIIKLSKLSSRIFSLAAVLRSRTQFGRRGVSGLAARLIRRLPNLILF